MKEEATEIEQAMAILKRAFRDDPEFAYGWHSNIAMSCYDAMPSGGHAENLRIGNEAATRFMNLAFGVETSQDMLDGFGLDDKISDPS